MVGAGTIHLMGLGLSFILLFVGLALLWKSGDWAVSNAIRFSIVFRIESFIIGFFIFALVTGFPEITSAMISSLKKVPELSSGNLVGSAFVNLTLQLGISSILAKKLIVEPFLKGRLIRTSITVAFVISLLLFFNRANLYLGLGLVLLYFVSFFWMPRANKETFKQEVAKEIKVKKTYFSPKIDVLLKLFASLGFLVLSAWISVVSAVSIAQILQMPLVVIGATIIAVGTALPELTLEIHAIRRKEYGLALGDIFGSSLLNITLILGMLISFNPGLVLNAAKMVFPFFIPTIALILYRLIRSQVFNRVDGVVLILLFCIYVSSVAYFTW